MNDDTAPVTPAEQPLPAESLAFSAFLPIALIGLSLVFILMWQISNANTERGQLEQGIAQREALLPQAHQIQTGLEKLVVDLLDVGKDDDDAKAIIAKYNIQRSGKPAPEGTAAAPSAAESPAGK